MTSTNNRRRCSSNWCSIIDKNRRRWEIWVKLSKKNSKERLMREKGKLKSCRRRRKSSSGSSRRRRRWTGWIWKLRRNSLKWGRSRKNWWRGKEKSKWKMKEGGKKNLPELLKQRESRSNTGKNLTIKPFFWNRRSSESLSCKGRGKKLLVLELHRNNKEDLKLNMLLNRKRLLSILQTISRRTKMKLEVR